MTLKFSPAGHKYWLDGKPVPGVTTLLGKGLPKPALPYWAAKSVAEYVVDSPEAVDQLRTMGRNTAIAALKGVPWEKRDQAAVRGTDVHRFAEELAHGRIAEDVPEHLIEYVEGYARFLDAFDVTAILTERTVASRKWWYAGTFDLIAEIGGVVWGLDNKTSKSVYGETGLQVAAYMTAEFYVGDDGPDDERPIPQVERMGVLHVTDAGTQLYPMGGRAEIEKAAGIFRHVAYVANQTDWIKAQVGEPLVAPSTAVA